MERGRILIVPFPSGGVLRTSKPQDWKSLAKNQHVGPMQEVRHDGQTYFRITGAPDEAFGAFAPMIERSLSRGRATPRFD